MSANPSAHLNPSQAARGNTNREKTLLQVAVTEAFGLLNAGAPDQAVAHIKQYAHLAAVSEVGCYVMGLIYFNADDLRSALSWFDRALALQPAYAEALGGRAIVLQRLGRPQEALESFEAILKLRPEDVEILFSIGVVRQSLGRMNEALTAYEQALRLRPNYCEALTNRGALLERFGRFDEALECFQSVFAIKPEDSVNLFNKGSVLQKLGRLDEALAAYEEAARLGPPDAETELNRGNVLQKLDRVEEAIACYDRALKYRQNYPQAFYNKGIALQALARLEEALAAYDAALKLEPSYCEAWCNRGNTLHELGRRADALASYREALKVRPYFLPALTNRANVLFELGRFSEALSSCDDALRHDNKHARALGLRGVILHKLGRLDEALTALEEACRLNPLSPEALLNRGNVLQEMDRLPEAIACYEEALGLKADYPEALSSLGVALKELGRIEDALACFNVALKHKPDYPDARNNRAGAFLLSGRLKEGFDDFESRWDRSNAPRKSFDSNLPKWNGEPLTGKRIIVWDEQGLGDLIQFCRYLPQLLDCGADVTFLARKNMHRLLSSLPKPVRLIEAIDGHENFDFQSALMSLPRVFQTTLGTIPAEGSYLKAEPDLVAKWAERIGSHGFRIGICWHGNAFINLRRSVPLSHFASLAAIEGVRLISLVKDRSARELERAGVQQTIEDLGAEFDAGPDSFIDCAAVMENLDLVITSDTSIAHLAGALGRPVFVVLKQVPDWRWMMDREDCPWYPAMRLFRQKARGDWGPVFDEIAAAVHARINAKANAAKNAEIAIPGAVGELIDKITILEIKASRIKDAAKLGNIRHELTLLTKLKVEGGFVGAELASLEAELKAINAVLWDVEDDLRLHEAREDFGPDFVALARQVYKTNDQRADLKRKINYVFNSAIVEEKSYSTKP